MNGLLEGWRDVRGRLVLSTHNGRRRLSFMLGNPLLLVVSAFYIFVERVKDTLTVLMHLFSARY